MINDFENSIYHLKVYGPNGFYREVKGAADDPLVQVVFIPDLDLATYKLANKKLKLDISNLEERPITIEIKDNAYKAAQLVQTIKPTNETTIWSHVTLDLVKSYGWYDFTMKISGNSTFERRYAGRVETGEPGKTDPFMGRVI
jgi:phospholipase C